MKKVKNKKTKAPAPDQATIAHAIRNGRGRTTNRSYFRPGDIVAEECIGGEPKLIMVTRKWLTEKYPNPPVVRMANEDEKITYKIQVVVEELTILRDQHEVISPLIRLERLENLRDRIGNLVIELEPEIRVGT